MKTPVIFRKEKDGAILAVFPLEPATCDGWYCTCYAHVGQHGACCPFYIRKDTKPAKTAESAALKRELESIGYTLRVLKRFPRNAYQIRKSQIK